MNTLRYSPYSDDIRRGIIWSVGIHTVVMIIFFVRAALVPDEPMDLRSAIRVDMVALPDKISAPPAPAPASRPEVVVKPETKVKPKVELKPKLEPIKVDKSAQQKAIDRIKAMSAIDRLKNEVAEREAKEKPQTFKGNNLSEGDSLTGLERIDYDRYFGGIKNHVMQNWRLPGWLAEAQLRAQAIVQIDESGDLISRKILVSSGNDVFDSQVLDAIDKSEPFPAPPDRLKSMVALKGIVFNFPE